MYKLLQILAISVITTLMVVTCRVDEVSAVEPSKTIIIEETVEHKKIDIKINDTLTTRQLSGNNTLIKHSLTEENIRLIALLTIAEAEGECETGKRLVIDTVLNRMDSEYFPASVEDVVYQKNQFSSMWNGRVNKVTVTEDVLQLVREELQSRTNYEVVFFTAGDYSKYGEEMFPVENHYFSRKDV